MVRAFRDTWHLGTHSYLSYLRERFLLARTLLSTKGSLFVQISDENIHRVMQILDEVFGSENYCQIIAFRKKLMPLGASLLEGMYDYILWYAKDRNEVRFRHLYRKTTPKASSRWTDLQFPNGARRKLTANERANAKNVPSQAEFIRLVSQRAPSFSANNVFEFEFEGQSISPPAGGCWVTSSDKMNRLAAVYRLALENQNLSYVLKHSDYPYSKFTNVWTDSSPVQGKRYVVQTSDMVIERCLLMTTEPGDLVLDPTAGSGTTGYVAEKWGRRWILVDSSRVSLAIARQRLLTGNYRYYKLRDGSSAGKDQSGVDPSVDFVYESLPKITMASIASNENIDPIISKHEEILNRHLVEVNRALQQIDHAAREKLIEGFASTLAKNGVRSISAAEIREYLLPGITPDKLRTALARKVRLSPKQFDTIAQHISKSDEYQHWNVPFDCNPEWPDELSRAVTSYRSAWRRKMDEIDECISSNCEVEQLVDRPETVNNILRVSGPFTVEGVRPEELSLAEDGQVFDPTPNEFEANGGAISTAQNASAYLDRMIQLLRKDGVTFPNNEHRLFDRLEPLFSVDSELHAEATWRKDGGSSGDEVCNVAIAFGPQHGPVTAEQVEDLVRASRRYDELVVAGFSFDGAAQTVIQESANPRLKIHMAHIRPDVSPSMDGLLKDSPQSQIFSVFGQPEVELRTNNDGEYEVELLGVDIYDPITGEIRSSRASKVAAWFLDQDYDGRCFCITQAFFPNQKAWDKIAKAIGSAAEAMSQYDGTVSLPFERGKYGRIAVKVIDPRGNEVMAILKLADAS